MLKKTLEICRKGCYEVHGRQRPLKLSREQMEKAIVLLPEEIAGLQDFPVPGSAGGETGHSCLNLDSFTLARQLHRDYDSRYLPDGTAPVCVLNFANAFHPGGGVRFGAMAQEEDLCRKSSLLLSLEGQQAASYYRYHEEKGSELASDAVIFTPYVEIIRDEAGNLLEDSSVVSVITCAAPNIGGGLEGLSVPQYVELFDHRIQAILRCAAYMGCRYLVLGAFGCGAFGNDSALVAELFRQALKKLNLNGLREGDLFDRVDFAVLCRGQRTYNFHQFYERFGDDPGVAPAAEKGSADSQK